MYNVQIDYFFLINSTQNSLLLFIFFCYEFDIVWQWVNKCTWTGRIVINYLLYSWTIMNFQLHLLQCISWSVSLYHLSQARRDEFHVTLNCCLSPQCNVLINGKWWLFLNFLGTNCIVSMSSKIIRDPPTRQLHYFAYNCCLLSNRPSEVWRWPRI